MSKYICAFCGNTIHERVYCSSLSGDHDFVLCEICHKQEEEMITERGNYIPELLEKYK